MYMYCRGRAVFSVFVLFRMNSLSFLRLHFGGDNMILVRDDNTPFWVFVDSFCSACRNYRSRPPDFRAA